jgi:hypothetical protein
VIIIIIVAVVIIGAVVGGAVGGTRHHTNPSVGTSKNPIASDGSSSSASPFPLSESATRGNSSPFSQLSSAGGGGGGGGVSDGGATSSTTPQSTQSIGH